MGSWVLGPDRVGKDTYTDDLDLDYVAMVKRRGSRRSSGRDQGPRLECHDPADERHQLRDREMHVAGLGPLALRAIDPAEKLERTPIQPADHSGTDRTKGVEPLGPPP